MSGRKDSIESPDDNDDHKSSLSPPSWDEVMAEKSAGTNMSDKQENSEILRNGPGKYSQDLIGAETEDKTFTYIAQETLVENEDFHTLSARERLLIVLNSIIWCLKTTSQVCTCVSDIILWICSVGAVTLGFMLIEHKFEVGNVLYRLEFYNSGKAIVTLGFLYIVVICPLGIIGTWRKKGNFLKWHNFWLVVNVAAHLIIIYIMYKYLNKADVKRKESYLAEMNSIYDSCSVENGNENSDGSYCCCLSENDTICWQYFTKEKPPINTGMRNRGLKLRYQEACIKKIDYYERTIDAITNAFKCLVLFTIVEISALFFAMFQNQVLKSEDSELNELKRRRHKVPKGRVRKVIYKIKRVIYRRLLFVLFAIIFALGLVFYKLWMRGFEVKLGMTKLNVLDILWFQFKRFS